jgi:hypothetical protein
MTVWALYTGQPIVAKLELPVMHVEIHITQYIETVYWKMKISNMVV